MESSVLHCTHEVPISVDTTDNLDSVTLDLSLSRIGSDAKPADIIKTYPVKLPVKGDSFIVDVVDSCNVPHTLFLKNTDVNEKQKLDMLLAKKSLEPLTCMPMSQLEVRTYVLVKFRNPAKLLRAQVKRIVNDQKIDVQDIDSGSVYRVTCQDIFALDDEQIAHIYPLIFVCTLSEFNDKDIYWYMALKNENKDQADTKGNEDCSNKIEGGANPSDRTDSSHVDKQSDAKPADIIKTYPVKLPVKEDRSFFVKVVDSYNVTHKLFLKNTDKKSKKNLNMLLAKKSLEPLTCMPISQLEERTFVLVKFPKPPKLLRAQVKRIVNDQKIDVQDIDSGSVYRVTCQDIFALDDEQIAHIYPRLFVCTLSEFNDKDIYWYTELQSGCY